LEGWEDGGRSRSLRCAAGWQNVGLEPCGGDCWAVDGSGEGWVAVVLAVPALHDDLFEGLFVGGAVHLGDGGDGTVGLVFDYLVH